MSGASSQSNWQPNKLLHVTHMRKPLLLLSLCKQLILVLLMFYGNFNYAQDLLPEEEAFKLNASILGENRVLVNWEIAEGYYLYKDKLGFEFSGNNIISTPPELPLWRYQK